MSVYIVQAGGDDGPVKIGRSDGNLNTRLSGIQTGSADKLTLLREIPGSRTVEAWLHKKFKASHIRGEWFEYQSDMLTVEVPKALLDDDKIGVSKTKQEDKIEDAAFDYHIRRGFSELATPHHIAAHQALLLRAFRNGSLFMALANDALARLKSAQAGGDVGATEKAEERYRNICEIAERWDEEVRRLDAIIPPSSLVGEEVSEAVSEPTAVERGRR